MLGQKNCGIPGCDEIDERLDHIGQGDCRWWVGGAAFVRGGVGGIRRGRPRRSSQRDKRCVQIAVKVVVRFGEIVADYRHRSRR